VLINDSKKDTVLKIWGRPSAYNVQKVLWFIDELRLEYEHIEVGSVEGELDSKEFIAMNPHARIPVMKDGDLIVWESNTIIRYLASEYGRDLYWVENPADRTLVERWVDWELASLQPDFLSLFWANFRTPENQRDAVKIEYFVKRCERNLTILNDCLKNSSFVAGSEFSIADISVGTMFYRYFNMGVSTPELPNVNRWYERLTIRPAYQKNIMFPFEELRGRLEF